MAECAQLTGIVKYEADVEIKGPRIDSFVIIVDCQKNLDVSKLECIDNNFWQHKKLLPLFFFWKSVHFLVLFVG